MLIANSVCETTMLSYGCRLGEDDSPAVMRNSARQELRLGDSISNAALLRGVVR